MGISLSHARYEEIKQIVVDLFVRYNVSCVPVNGFELATKMGITVVAVFCIFRKQALVAVQKSEDGFCVQKTPANGLFIIMTKGSMDA